MGDSREIMANGTIGFPGECFFFMVSLTVSDPFRLTWLSMCWIPPLLWLETWRSAALTLPSIMSLANVRVYTVQVYTAIWKYVQIMAINE